MVVNSEPLRVVLANLRYGGISKTGYDSAWQQTMSALAPYNVDVALMQEMEARDPRDTNRHLLRTANALGGLQPFIGMGALPTYEIGGHTAIMVRTEKLTPVDFWPPPAPIAERLPWCNLAVEIPGHTGLLDLFSVHVNARSGTKQLAQVETLASIISEKRLTALVGGDFNGYPRTGLGHTAEEIDRAPAHQRHCRTRPDASGTYVARHDVVDALERDTDLVDIAAALPPERRDPAELCGTADDGARIDRLYGHPGIANAALTHRQIPIGSDHNAQYYESNLCHRGFCSEGCLNHKDS